MGKNNEKKSWIEIIYWLLFVLLILYVAYLSFHKLDVKYVDPWDEARHGVNAYEMSHGGSLVQNTYLRQADYYNLKPPMSMWCIMLSMRLFGDTVFALRFYSALCYVILVAVVGLFVKRYGKIHSVFAMLFLACNTTPFQAHMIRSGDADSLYVLLFTLAMLAMMKVKDNVKYVYACGLLFSLAFLTKSFHAFIILAIGGMYLILTGDIRKLKIKDWALFIAAAVLPTLAWALLRMRIDGITFFKAMWETDVLGRTDGTLQNNIAPFSYYFSYYFGTMSGKTTPYLCALVLCMIAAVAMSNKLVWKNRSAYLGYVLWIAVPFFAFSLVTNKLLWYVYPSLVALLMTAGIAMGALLENKEILKGVRAFLVILALVAVYNFASQEMDVISAQGGNDFQLLIQKVAKEEGLQGSRAYVDYDEKNPNWSQQDVFVAEAYGDFTCVNGGLMSVLASDTIEGMDGILFVGADAFLENAQMYERYELIAEENGNRAYRIGY